MVRAPRTRRPGRRWTSRWPCSALLARRLPFSVPTPKGFVALKEGGRAAVYPYLPGRTLDLTDLPAGPGLAAEIGRAIAALHNVDRQLFDEAGLPSYDADTYRTRRLAELDRAAATGHVPTALLARWEAALEDVSLWRFAPTPTHGDLTGDQVLAVFDDDEDASTGRVRAFTGWEDAKVADPADDFAALVSRGLAGGGRDGAGGLRPRPGRAPRPAPRARARLVAELRLLSALMAATARAQGADQGAVASCAARLRRLDEHAADHPLTEPKVVPAAAGSVPTVAPVPPVGRRGLRSGTPAASRHNSHRQTPRRLTKLHGLPMGHRWMPRCRLTTTRSPATAGSPGWTTFRRLARGTPRLNLRVNTRLRPMTWWKARRPRTTVKAPPRSDGLGPARTTTRTSRSQSRWNRRHTTHGD